MDMTQSPALKTSRIRPRSLVLALAAGLALSAFSASAPAGVMAVAKDAKCKVYRRDDQRRLTLFWHGRCEKGFAEGVGALRLFDKKELHSAFYGEIKKGRWTSGAYEEGTSGFLAGPFTPENELQVQEPVDQTKIIQAFKDAAAGAEALAKQFKRDGDKESAAKYFKKAKQLRSQIE